MKKLIISLCLIGLIFIGQTGAGETQKPPLQIAIYPFQAVGIGETVATVITNAVYRELVNSNKLIVRDQKSTQAAIDQIGLSQSGLCSEDACTVEAGKIIKAQKLIMGSVEMVMENYYTVSMRVVDVQTARTEYQVQHDCKSCKNNVEIRDFAVKVVKESILVYLETGKKVEYKPSETASTASTASTVAATAAPSPTSGTVSISSAPTGADAWVDGNYVGKTPINFSGVTPGSHKVQVQLAGYIVFDSAVNVTANQVAPVNANLAAEAPVPTPSPVPDQNKYDPVPAPAANKAMVVFFRKSAFTGAALSYKIHDADIILGTLSNGAYFYYETDPGQHKFWAKTESMEEITLDLKNGETQFVEGEIKMGVMVGRPKLTSVSPSEGMTAIKKCRYRPITK